MAVKQTSAKLRIAAVGTTHTHTNPLPVNIAAGSSLLVGLVYYYDSGAAPSSLTIGGQAATLDRAENFFGSQGIQVWRVQNHPGGNRGTITYSVGAGAYVTGQLLELDQFDATPLDQTANGNGSGTTTTATSGTTTQADEFVLAIAMAAEGNSNANWATPSGYTAGFLENDSISYQGGTSAYRYVTATGVQTAAFTRPVSMSSSWVITTYKATPSGGGSYTLVGDGGAFALSGQAATLKAGRSLGAVGSSYALTGQAAAINHGRKIEAVGAGFTVSGQAAELHASRLLVAESGAYALTGAAATMVAGRRLTAASGAYGWAGQEAALTYAPIATGYVLAADGGSFTITGDATSLRYGRRLAIDPAVYVWSGTAASVNRGRRLVADAGAVALTGGDVLLVYAPSTGTTLTAEPGAFALAGSAVAMRGTRRLVANGGVLALIGGSVDLRAGTAIPNRSAWRRSTGSQSRPAVPNNERSSVGSSSRPATPNRNTKWHSG